MKKAKKKRHAPKFVAVGTYSLDGHPMRIQLEWERENAYVVTVPEDGGAAVAGIGCDYGRVTEEGILDRVIHEALEVMWLSRGLAYEPWGESGIDMSNRVFLVNHQQFQGGVHFLAHFLHKSMPDVLREYKAMKKAHGRKP